MKGSIASHTDVII